MYKPVLGAKNDTSLLINQVFKAGDYRVSVKYPNGCVDTSIIYTIYDGSFAVDLFVDTVAPARQDFVICNGTGKTLKVTDTDTMGVKAATHNVLIKGDDIDTHAHADPEPQIALT